MKEPFTYIKDREIKLGFNQKETFIGRTSNSIVEITGDQEIIREYDMNTMDLGTLLEDANFPRKGTVSPNGMIALAGYDRNASTDGLAMIDRSGWVKWFIDERTEWTVFDTENNLMYLRTNGNTWGNVIEIRNPEGELVFAYPESSVSHDPFTPYPDMGRGVTFDLDGNIIFCDTHRYHTKFVKIDRDKNVIWGQYQESRLWPWTNIVVDKSNNFYYAKYDPCSTIAKRNSAGQIVWEYADIRNHEGQSNIGFWRIFIDGEENIYGVTNRHNDYDSSFIVKISNNPNVITDYVIEDEPVGRTGLPDDYGWVFFVRWPPIDDTENVSVFIGAEDSDGVEYRIEVDPSEYTINYETGEIEFSQRPRDYDADIGHGETIEVSYTSTSGRNRVESAEWIWLYPGSLLWTSSTIAITESGQVFATRSSGPVVKADTSQAPTDGSKFSDIEWQFSDEDLGEIEYIWAKPVLAKWLAEAKEAGGS